MNHVAATYIIRSLEECNSVSVRLCLLTALEAWIGAARQEEERRRAVRESRHAIYAEFNTV